MTNNNSTSCSPYDGYDYVIVAAVSSGSAMVSALCCIFVIGLIFLFKKHYFFIQRLILYHCVATLLRAIALILRFHRLGDQNDFAVHIVCVISAFLDQVTLWYLALDYVVITFTLLMAIVFHKNMARLEGLFVVLIFIFPLTFNWIPFIDDSYGRYGAWCWIRTINYDDCSEHEFGTTLQGALWNIPFTVFLVVLIPAYIIVIAFVARQKYRRRHKLMHDKTTDIFEKSLNEEILPLLFYPIGALLINTLPLTNVLYNAIHDNSPLYGLSLATAVLSPLQGGYIALVYTLDRDTLRRLTYSNLVATLCERRDEIQEYPAEPCGLSDSVTSAEVTVATNYINKRTNDGEIQPLLWNARHASPV